MAGVTNKGKYVLLGNTFRGETPDTTLYIALLTDASAPTADTNVFDSPLDEIDAGNGYVAGGTSLTPGATDFDVWTEDDTNDRALVQLKDITWTATGGAIPATGDDARYFIITDANGTQTLREVFCYGDLGGDYGVSEDQDLTLEDVEIRINEPA